jgi:hypothetical protein
MKVGSVSRLRRESGVSVSRVSRAKRVRSEESEGNEWSYGVSGKRGCIEKGEESEERLAGSTLVHM